MMQDTPEGHFDTHGITEHIKPRQKIKSLILTGAEFVKGFRPPDYLIDGMIQQSYLYSLTARTGHGKTAVAMYAAQCVARGTPVHGRKTKQGAVLFLAGENPDDVRARYIMQADQEGFDPANVPFYFIDGVIDIAASLPRIRAEAAKIPNLVLVIVDTAAAYFRGDEDNSNTQKLIFAQQLRRLTKLPGKPAVIVNCHPIKNATKDNLIPVGGGAFLNEMDGNLPLWADDKVCTLSPHLDKWRGVSFEPVSFDLKTAYCEKVVDAEGRQMPSVIAVPITEAIAERKAVMMENDEDTVLRLIHVDKHASFAVIAKRAGFVWPDGSPAKSKVQKIVERLKDEKLIFKYRGSKYRLTKKGCAVIKVEFEGDG
jgi:AAA domain